MKLTKPALSLAFAAVALFLSSCADSGLNTTANAPTGAAAQSGVATPGTGAFGNGSTRTGVGGAAPEGPGIR